MDIVIRFTTSPLSHLKDLIFYLGMYSPSPYELETFVQGTRKVLRIYFLVLSRMFVLGRFLESIFGQ
jgi:hypothetical protein